MVHTNKVVDYQRWFGSHVVSANKIELFKERLDKFKDKEDREC